MSHCHINVLTIKVWNEFSYNHLILLLTCDGSGVGLELCYFDVISFCDNYYTINFIVYWMRKEMKVACLSYQLKLEHREYSLLDGFASIFTRTLIKCWCCSHECFIFNLYLANKNYSCTVVAHSSILWWCWGK